MPQFDLRNIMIANYVNTNGVVSYTGKQQAGEAMTANIELRAAEGRLYAESRLAEYMRKVTGGTISLGLKYVKTAAQKVMFGMRDGSTSVTPAGGSSTTVASLKLGAQDEGNYVGVAFYSPDMIDGAKKYTAVKINKVLFGPPSMSLQTAGDSIQFQTPTVNGEFLADDSATKELYEIAVCDTEALAIAWVNKVLGGS